MTIWNVRRAAAIAAAMAITIGTVATAHAQKTAPAKPNSGAAGQKMDPLTAVKEGMKRQYGFTDAQADTVAKKAMAIAQSYQPKLKTIQAKYAKYGNNLTPQQQQQRMAEIIPIVSEISKKTSKVLLAVATKEQRPRILQMVQAEQQRLDMMAKGGAKPK